MKTAQLGSTMKRWRALLTVTGRFCFRTAVCETEPDSVEKKSCENAYVMACGIIQLSSSVLLLETTDASRSVPRYTFIFVNCHGKTNSPTEALKVLGASEDNFFVSTCSVNDVVWKQFQPSCGSRTSRQIEFEIIWVLSLSGNLFCHSFRYDAKIIRIAHVYSCFSR